MSSNAIYKLNIKCKICGSNSPAFDTVDFNKFCSTNPYSMGISGTSVAYYRCNYCKFIFTPLIDELSNSQITKLIYNEDYALVDPEYLGARSIFQAKEFGNIYKDFKHLKILDFGSGMGYFEKELRRMGFYNIESYDPFSNPSLPKTKFDLITSFECIEHDPHPIKTFQLMKSLLSDQGTILIGTALQPVEIDAIGCRWWYVAPRNGHVSIFHENSFFALSRSCDLKYAFLKFHFFFKNEPIFGALNKQNNNLPEKTRELRIYAPLTKANGWQDIEFGRRMKYRWTSQNVITWHNLLLKKGVTRISIPFCNAIQKNFPYKCQIKVGSVTLKTEVVNEEICANFSSRADEIFNVHLLTPSPISPHSIGINDDSRLLGIAIIAL